MVDLGTPAGGTFAPNPERCPSPDEGVPLAPLCLLGAGLRGIAISEPGTIAVQGLGGPETLWERETFVPLTGLGVVTAVNNSGQAAGNVGSRAALFDHGEVVLLPIGTDGAVGSRAWGMNDHGDVVGALLFPAGTGPAGAIRPRAALWRRTGEVIDLGALDPGRGSEAYAINNRGQAVGVSGSNSLTSGSFRAVRPVMFSDGQVFDLGGSPSCAGEAYAVNEQGTVAGKLCNTATVWDKGQAVSLPTPLGAVGSAAFGINDRGDVVGRILFPRTSSDPYRNYTVEGPALGEPFAQSLDDRWEDRFSITSNREIVPALWRDGALTVLPLLEGRFRQQGAAYDVNNRGQIAGTNLVDDRLRAVLWTVPGAFK